MKQLKFTHRKIRKLNVKQNLKDIAYTFYSYLPRKYRKKIEKEKIYAGIEGDKSVFCGALILIMWLVGLIESAVLFVTFHVPIHLALIPSFIMLPFGYYLPYLLFTYMAEGRRKRMEAVLPDILMLIAANIKSGLTIDRAILFASRPEFGELAQEFKKVAFEIYGGEDVGTAFKKLVNRVKSVSLERTVKLLLEGIKSGGTIANLLEETANDLRTAEVLQREIRSNVSMYMMFIFIAGVIAAPFLFAISNVLLSTTTSVWGGVTIGEEASQFLGGGFITMKPVQLDVHSFSIFSILCLVINIIFASILISIIQNGSAKEAIKYIPPFIILSLSIYYGTIKVMEKIFSIIL